MPKGKKNAYICPRLHATITIDREEGTTPMFLMCPVCEEQAVSKMYQLDQSLEPTHEWYKPDEKEIEDEITSLHKLAPGMQKEHIEQSIREHVTMGGLLFRSIPGAPKKGKQLVKEYKK